MEPTKSKFRQHLSENKWFYIVLLLMFILAGYLFISKMIQAKQHAQELEQTKTRYEEEVNKALLVNAERQLTLMMKTFVWAVRSSMLRDNLDEVDQYFVQLIQEKKITDIVLADSQGNILVATNKKYEGQPFANFYPAEVLMHDDVHFSQSGDKFYISAPVMSLNTRLGTLLVVYEADRVHLDQPHDLHQGQVDTLQGNN